jgi:hypothetical protein
MMTSLWIGGGPADAYTTPTGGDGGHAVSVASAMASPTIPNVHFLALIRTPSQQSNSNFRAGARKSACATVARKTRVRTEKPLPISFEIDQEKRRIRTTAEGAVTVADVAGHLEDLVERAIEAYSELIDATQATRPGWYSADVRKAADLISTLRGSPKLGPRAVVVTRAAAFGMVRMLSVLIGSRLRLEVFRDVASAEEWLDGAASRPGPGA